MINLNDNKYNIKPLINKNILLSEIGDYSIFKSYCKNFNKPNEVFSSPFRIDNNPSFGIFYSKIYNVLLFKDLKTGEIGDCFTFVRKLYNISLWDALSLIAKDFKLQDKYLVGECRNPNPINNIKIETLDEKYKKNKVTSIKITSRLFRVYDLDFWQQFGIFSKTLTKFRVVPVEYVHINDFIVKADKYSYAYLELKDSIVTYKIYQPFSVYHKWLTNHPPNVHQGYYQLPEKGDLLIITKSLKDVMSIYDVTGIPSIGIQAETVYIKPSVMDEYKQRFKKVICLFDNDETGKAWSQKYNEVYNIPYILIPDEYKSKDFSDLVKNKGIYEAKDILKCVINNN